MQLKEHINECVLPFMNAPLYIHKRVLPVYILFPKKVELERQCEKLKTPFLIAERATVLLQNFMRPFL